MDSPASAIVRAKSDQLEIVQAAARQSLSHTESAEALATATPIAASSELNGGSGSLRKASFGKRVMGSSPGRKGGGHHIRKARSAQLKLDLEDVNSGSALSRASSASFGFSFSFTGFTVPPEDIIADLKGLSDEENAIDPDAGCELKRIITEPTLPIYLKTCRMTPIHEHIHLFSEEFTEEGWGQRKFSGLVNIHELEYVIV